jgi:hypothetical protein
MRNIISIPFNSLELHVVNYLPTEKTVKACCLVTRLEVKILTGELIHCMNVGNKLFVSQELHDKLLEKESHL